MDKEAQLIWEAYTGRDKVGAYPHGIVAVYGNIWLKDGTEIPLDGPESVQQFVNIDPDQIQSIGQHEIGDEADVVIEYDDGSSAGFIDHDTDGEMLDATILVRNFLRNIQDRARRKSRWMK